MEGRCNESIVLSGVMQQREQRRAEQQEAHAHLTVVLHAGRDVPVYSLVGADALRVGGTAVTCPRREAAGDARRGAVLARKVAHSRSLIVGISKGISVSERR